ncbi:MAG: nucleoside 2-deoxyribosyltransferase [Oscillospiraceae bacterium]|jgi:hypothetical protein|nr:nucleoside 2-deoxyribosyltransferase [Oscillospiraceae bacterium]
MASKKTCFVITPIGDPKAEIRRKMNMLTNAIKEMLKDDFTVKGPLDYNKIGDIPKYVIEALTESDLVIANLSGDFTNNNPNPNPNVMYELGIRYSIGKPVVLVAEKGTKLSFDINHEKVIQFGYFVDDFETFKGELARTITHIDFSNFYQGPVVDIIKAGSPPCVYNQFAKIVENVHIFAEIYSYITSVDHDHGLVNKDVIIFALDLSFTKAGILQLVNIVSDIDIRILALDRSAKDLTTFKDGLSWNSDTLDSNVNDLANSTNAIKRRNNSLEVRSSSIAYPYQGIIIDDLLFFNWINIIDGNKIQGNTVTQMLQRNSDDGFSMTQFDSFKAWFEYYWKYARVRYSSDHY